jgi:hypothetical protein
MFLVMCGFAVLLALLTALYGNVLLLYAMFFVVFDRHAEIIKRVSAGFVISVMSLVIFSILSFTLSPMRILMDPVTITILLLLGSGGGAWGLRKRKQNSEAVKQYGQNLKADSELIEQDTMADKSLLADVKSMDEWAILPRKYSILETKLLTKYTATALLFQADSANMDVSREEHTYAQKVIDRYTYYLRALVRAKWNVDDYITTLSSSTRSLWIRSWYSRNTKVQKRTMSKEIERLKEVAEIYGAQIELFLDKVTEDNEFYNKLVKKSVGNDQFRDEYIDLLQMQTAEALVLLNSYAALHLGRDSVKYAKRLREIFVDTFSKYLQECPRGDRESLKNRIHNKYTDVYWNLMDLKSDQEKNSVDYKIEFPELQLSTANERVSTFEDFTARAPLLPAAMAPPMRVSQSEDDNI